MKAKLFALIPALLACVACGNGTTQKQAQPMPETPVPNVEVVVAQTQDVPQEST